MRNDFAETAITSASDDALAAVHAIDDTKSAADPLDVFGERSI